MKDSYFELKPCSTTHTHAENCSNTDTVTHSTVTHSNHNSESADSQPYRQTPLSANTHTTASSSLKMPGEVSMRPGHFPFVRLSVHLSLVSYVCSQALSSSRHLFLFWGSGRYLMTNLLFVVHQNGSVFFADVYDVMFSFLPTFLLLIYLHNTLSLPLIC